MNQIHTSVAKVGLVRPTHGRVLAGVCAGIGRRLGISANLTRVLFVISLIVIPGSQILVYPLLWLLMPSEEQAGNAWRSATAPTWPNHPTSS